jgi:4-amino-4-deoxy-L-arabinose transferase-like glycosyltransferase
MTDLLDHPVDLETIIVGDEPAPPRSPGRLRRLWRGPESDPAYARPALLVLLGLTAALYLWDLGASDWANSYYAMAVQAATKSWKAMFFGSLDASNSITVDKPPASLWVMDISARIFGLNSWSMLVPQALEGVAAVGVLYATIKRWFGPPAALLAGAVLALTPVGALMFRYNNPDALLVLLLVGGAYALTRAIERGSTGWLVSSFALVGFAFLAKELQALVVVPAFGLAYLLAGPPRLARRIGQLALGAVALLASAGWWVAIVQLWPASSRPYIGGSQTNSLWNVIFGYNGFGRLTGNETGSVGGGPVGASQWGPTGLTRLFSSSFGGDASWLIPAALILLVAGLWFTIRMPRTDRTRAALIIWGGWLLITGLAFSLGQGIIHPYYTVALGPAIGAIVGIGATRLWNGRTHPAARAVLAVAFAATAWWSYKLLARTPNWHPGLRAFVALGGVVGTVLLAISALPAFKRGVTAIAAGALVVALAGPAAYTLSTVATPHQGAIPSAGPAAAAALAGPGGGPRGGRGFGGFPGAANGQFTPPNFGANGNGFGNFTPPNNGFGFTGPQGGRGGAGGAGGLLNGSKPSTEVTQFLHAGASGYRWVAATVGAENASGYQLASGDPVMSLGGFNGTDPSPTLAQFQSYVANHQVHYFITGGGFGGGRGGGPGGSSSSVSAITQWVENNFTSHTIGNVTYYDLTGN